MDDGSDIQPKRLPAGRTDFSVVDRLALQQLIYAYGVYIDTFQYDEFFSLFTDDAEFVLASPGEPQVAVGRQDFEAFTLARFEQFKEAGRRRRHLMQNILFDEQTDLTAHGEIFATLVNLETATAELVTTIRYEGWFTKQGDIWKIRRWVDGPDIAVA